MSARLCGGLLCYNARVDRGGYAGPKATGVKDRETGMSMYSSYSQDTRPKVRIAVEIVTDDTTVSGHLFLNPNERLIDMMNDSRQYVAFEHGG